jgi:predicted NUDIX family phosphoesterase
MTQPSGPAAESVFAVARAHAFGGEWPQGFVPAAEVPPGTWESWERLGFFADRAEAERNPAWKQPIPYCLVYIGARLLVVERLRAQSEARLHGRLSVGIGGHIEPCDARGPRGLLATAMLRELEEELEVVGLRCAEPKFLGLINDDGDPVGQVHVGLVHEVRLPEVQSWRVREMSKMRGRLSALADLLAVWQDSQRFESWSRIILGALLQRRGGSPQEDQRSTHEEASDGRADDDQTLSGTRV